MESLPSGWFCLSLCILSKIPLQKSGERLPVTGFSHESLILDCRLYRGFRAFLMFDFPFSHGFPTKILSHELIIFAQTNLSIAMILLYYTKRISSMTFPPVTRKPRGFLSVRAGIGVFGPHFGPQSGKAAPLRSAKGRLIAARARIKTPLRQIRCISVR